MTEGQVDGKLQVKHNIRKKRKDTTENLTKYKKEQKLREGGLTSK